MSGKWKASNQVGWALYLILEFSSWGAFMLKNGFLIKGCGTYRTSTLYDTVCWYDNWCFVCSCGTWSMYHMSTMCTVSWHICSILLYSSILSVNKFRFSCKCWAIYWIWIFEIQYQTLKHWKVWFSEWPDYSIQYPFGLQRVHDEEYDWWRNCMKNIAHAGLIFTGNDSRHSWFLLLC